MFCIECGYNLPDDAEFCPKCGAKVQSEESVKATDAKTPEERPVPAEPIPEASINPVDSPETISTPQPLSLVTTSPDDQEKVIPQQFVFCIECGNKLPTDAVFCDKCGAKMIPGKAADVALLAENSLAEPLVEWYNVELTEVGPKKANVLYTVQKLTGLGLKEAIELVDGAPKMLKKAISLSEANSIKEELATVGALITIFGKDNYVDTNKQALESSGSRRLSCPNCHSYDILPTQETETNVSGGGYGVGKGCCGWIFLGPFGLLCGLCGRDVKANSTTRQFWICRSCGHKFQSDEDKAKDENEEMKRVFFSAFGVSVIMLIAGIVFNINEIRFLWIPAWLYIVLGILGTILFGLALLISYVMSLPEERAEELAGKLDAIINKFKRK